MLINRARLCLVVFLVLTHTFMCAYLQAKTSELQVVANCASINSTSITSTSVARAELSHWQHMTAYPTEFIGLKNPLNQYGAQSFDIINSSSSCLNTQITLVKKLIYNQHQHANGLEVNLSEHNLTFADLGTVNMRFQLDSKKNVLPTKQTLISLLTSNALLTTEDIEQLTAKLIDDNVHLKVMFYGEGHSNYKTPTLYAEANLVLSALSLQSASLEGNQWLELIIKSKELGTYWQQNWQETNVSFEDISTHAVKGFILVAETPSGKTLQSLMPDIVESIEESDLATEGMFIESFIRLGSIVISSSSSI